MNQRKKVKTMEQWLDFARGPLFKFCFLFMILGLGRHLILTIIGIVKGVKFAGDKNFNFKRLFIETLGWIIPFNKLSQRILFSITSVVFQIGLIIIPLFLIAHNQLWKKCIGFSLPSMSQNLAHLFTLVTITAIFILLIARIINKDSRAISRMQDYVLPILISIPFITGYLTSHIEINPFTYQTTMLLHVLSSNLIFILIPLTKLSHIVLLPSTQFVAEVGWHFPADSGKDVAKALKKENEQI